MNFIFNLVNLLKTFKDICFQFSLSRIMENIGRQMKKEPTDIKFMNLLRKGNTDSVKYVEPCDRVYDTWQIVRFGYFKLSSTRRCYGAMR